MMDKDDLLNASQFDKLMQRVAQAEEMINKLSPNPTAIPESPGLSNGPGPVFSNPIQMQDSGEGALQSLMSQSENAWSDLAQLFANP